MVKTSEDSGSVSQRKEERIFQYVVLGLAIFVGIGFFLAAMALSGHEESRGIAPDRPRFLTDFSLTDSLGRTVTKAQLDGKTLVVSFLFTSCATTCPEVSRRMAEIQLLTTNLPDVQLISITVDPRSDTPSTLAKWGEHYGADTNRWLMLTGSKPMLYQLIGNSFLTTNDSALYDYMPGHFVGTERIAIVDRRGSVRVYYDGLRPETARAVVAELNRLRNEH